MNEALGLVEHVQSLGGWGVAAIMGWFLKIERDERIRYRDLHEATLRALPELTRSVESLVKEVGGLSDEIARNG